MPRWEVAILRKEEECSRLGEQHKAFNSMPSKNNCKQMKFQIDREEVGKAETTSSKTLYI